MFRANNYFVIRCQSVSYKLDLFDYFYKQKRTMAFQDILLKQLKKRIMEQLRPEIKQDMDMIIFFTRVNDEGKMQTVKTVVTNKKGEKQEVNIKELSKKKGAKQ